MRTSDKISKIGAILLILGIGLLAVSVKDTIISFKTPLDFLDLLDEPVSGGEHVKGDVCLLLDSFAIEQTWTENSSTNSRTPKKTSQSYYVLPCYDGNLALAVRSADISTANRLVDETYGYLNGGTVPTTSFSMDCRIVKMDDELAEMYLDEMREYYGYTDAELDEMGPPLLIEGRAFTTIQIFCAAGAVFAILGVILLITKWRKVSEAARREEEQLYAVPDELA